MKTYSESKGKPVINWTQRLDSKAKNLTEHDEWSDDSSSWVTCACGNQCDVIPRNADGKPKDDILYDLGMRFYGAINSYNYEHAKQILIKIEERSTELINEINSRK